MQLTEVEKNILNFIREARPYEIIEIMKDQMGRPDHYLVTRRQKIVVSTRSIEAVKIKLG